MMETRQSLQVCYVINLVALTLPHQGIFQPIHKYWVFRPRMTLAHYHYQMEQGRFKPLSAGTLSHYTQIGLSGNAGFCATTRNSSDLSLTGLLDQKLTLSDGTLLHLCGTGKTIP